MQEGEITSLSRREGSEVVASVAPGWAVAMRLLLEVESTVE